LGLKEGTFKTVTAESFENSYQLFAEYIEWRAEHPSDDLVTQLLNAQIEEDEARRRLTRTEVLTYTSMIAGAGNEPQRALSVSSVNCCQITRTNVDSWRMTSR